MSSTTNSEPPHAVYLPNEVNNIVKLITGYENDIQIDSKNNTFFRYLRTSSHTWTSLQSKHAGWSAPSGNMSLILSFSPSMQFYLMLLILK